MISQDQLAGLAARLCPMFVMLDSDGVIDSQDEDSDNDGVRDIVEGANTQPFDVDSDGIPNYMDLDSDNDTLTDSFERIGQGGDADSDGPSVYVAGSISIANWPVLLVTIQLVSALLLESDGDCGVWVLMCDVCCVCRSLRAVSLYLTMPMGAAFCCRRSL